MTVVAAVASEGPPKYERAAGPTSFTPFEARVRQLLAHSPEMPATVLAEQVGWAGQIRWFRHNVNGSAPITAPSTRPTGSIWMAGDAAQWDLRFPPCKILLEDGTKALLPVLVMTCAFSRFILARMIPTRKSEDLLLGSWELLNELGAVPRRMIWGQRVRHRPAQADRTGRSLRRHPGHQGGAAPRRGTRSPRGWSSDPTDVRDLVHAGPALRVPSRLQRPVHALALDREPAHGTPTKARPIDLLETDTAAMLPLPPTVLHLGWRNHVRLDAAPCPAFV